MSKLLIISVLWMFYGCSILSPGQDRASRVKTCYMESIILKDNINEREAYKICEGMMRGLSENN